ncbi:MAG: exo-alpha-sialidase [Planctomyces sp.]
MKDQVYRRALTQSFELSQRVRLLSVVAALMMHGMNLCPSAMTLAGEAYESEVQSGVVGQRVAQNTGGAYGKVSDSLQRGEAAGDLVLSGLGDYQHVMNNYGKRPGTAIIFLSTRCPVLESQLKMIREIHQKYRRKEILYVGIVSDPDQSSEEIRDWMKKRGIIFPVYRDPEGTVRKRFGASVTPEIFLLDEAGRLRFRGGPGGAEEPPRKKASMHYPSAPIATDFPLWIRSLEMAILGLLEGVPVEVPDVPGAGTPITADLPPVERADLWGNVRFSSQMIFDHIPGASAYHCSTLTEAANGDLLCLWYGGTYESADDETLFLARLRPGEDRWSKPEPVISDPKQPPGNGILFVDGLKRLWLVWARLESARPIRRGSGWDLCRLMYRISEDHGKTWTEDRPFSVPEGTWAVPRNNALTLRSGRIVIPVEAVIGGEEGSVFLGSADHGQTWTMSPMVGGGSQPALAQRDDGTLFALMRMAPKITQVESKDEGLNWSKAVPTSVNNPDSGISMTRLKNGHLILIYNDSPDARTPLNIVRYIDDGKTWEKPLTLESNPGEYSYPCVIQTSDGMIHVTYTWRRFGIRHVQMNENWFTEFERPN